MPTEPRRAPPWADDLLDLAAEEATGRLVVVVDAGEEGWIQLRDGSLSAVSAATRRPLLSRRLTAFEVMTSDEVRAAMATVRQTPGAHLLDLLIHDRLVPEAFVVGYLRNTMAEQLGAIMAAGATEVRFEPGRVPRVNPLLLSVHEVLATATAIPHTFPDDIADLVLRAAAGPPPELVPIMRSVLAAADGRRRPVDVADACGLTAAETIQVINELSRKKLTELVAGTEHSGWGDAGVLSLGPPAGPAMDVPLPRTDTAPGTGATRPAGPAAFPAAPAAPAAAAAPNAPAAAAVAPETITPFAPAPVETEPAPSARTRSLPEDRREALSALKSLTEAVAADAEPPVPHVPAVKEPQSEVTTTSPRVWANRPTRPANPMESGEVLRELKSLGD